MSSRPLRSAAALLLVASAAVSPALAAPVSGDDVSADPYELALRWTLSALTVPGERSAAADAAPGAEPRPSPGVAVPSVGVPDPGAYALMGLGLLAAGLAARHLSSRHGPRQGQRGLSKKT